MRAALVLLVAAAVVGVVLWTTSAPDAPEPPRPDLAGQEEAVVARLDTLRVAVEEAPADTARWFDYGRCLHAHGFTDAARTCYDFAAGDESLAYDAHYLTGVLLASEERDAALTAFTKASALRDDDPALQLRLGQLHEELGRADEAERHFRRALELERSSHALLGLGRIAHAAGDAASARELLEAAARLAPAHRRVQAILASVCRSLGDHAAAKRHAERAERLDGDFGFRDPITMAMLETGASLNTFLTIANAALRRRVPRPDVTLRYADRALAADDDLAQAHYARARALHLLERPDEALASLERFLALEPEHVEALTNAAALHMLLEQPDRARQRLGQAYELEPENPEVLYLTGLLIWRRLPGEAERFVRRALEAEPDHVDARLHLATIHAAVGKLEEAEREVRTVLRLVPDHPRGREMLAKILGARGN